jgi:hypothetical protein
VKEVENLEEKRKIFVDKQKFKRLEDNESDGDY